MHTTSASLLRRLREPRETEAWSRFVRTYSPILYSWACHLGLQEADALDLVQEVFATLIKKLPEFRYDSDKGFRNWLWTVTKNKWREKSRRPRLPVDVRRRADQLPGPNDDAVEEADFQQFLLSRIVPAMREQFPPKTWQAFWRHVVEGQTAPQVAAELGITETMVYKAKLRVLARLHEELGDLI